MDPQLKRWRWRVFAATYACYAGLYFCRKPFFVVKADLGNALAFDSAMLGTIGAAYLISYAVGQFVFGYAGSRWGPRLVLLLGMAVSTVASIAFGITDSFATFLAFMVCNGLAQGTGWSGTVGTMGNWFHRQERGTVMGIWSTNYAVGGVLGGGLAALLLGALGYRYAFFGGSLVLTLVWVFFFFNQRNQPADVGLEPVQEPREDPTAPPGADEKADTGWTPQVITSVLLVGVFYFFVKFIRYALLSWAPYFLKLNFGLSGSNAGFLSIVFDVAGIAGVVASGWISDRYFHSRRAKLSLLLIIGMLGACLLMATVGRSGVWLFSGSMALIGFTLFGPDALMSGTAAIDIGAKRAGLAAGIINGIGQIGAVVQELLIGSLYKRGGGRLGPIFVVLLVSAAFAVLVLGVILWRNARGDSDV